MLVDIEPLCQDLRNRRAETQKEMSFVHIAAADGPS
jgi:hypothetical protein